MPGGPACPGCGYELEDDLPGPCPLCNWHEAKTRFDHRPAMGLARHYLPPPTEDLKGGSPAPAPPLKPGGKMRSPPKPAPPPQRDPLPLPSARRRLALIHQLAGESRFLEQRNEAAHRRFLRILDRVCPLEPPEEWSEIEVLGLRRGH